MWWLSGLIATDLDHLARRLGLTQRQTAVWTATIRGETLDAIALSLSIGLSTAHAHLVRAQQKARDSWLAVYSQECARHAPAGAGARDRRQMRKGSAGAGAKDRSR